MELQHYHLTNVSHTKKFGERSLEEPILKVHQGDQQVYDGDSQYRYLHRPIPQTSEKQPLHKLHPTIDQGSVFLSEKHYNPEWHHTRADIPNALNNNDEVADYRKKSFEYHTDEIETENHAKHLHKKYRYHPIFDQPHVSGDALRAIHHHNHPDNFYYVDGYAKDDKYDVHDVAVHQRHKGTDKIADTYNSPIHHNAVVEKDKSVLIEGYTGPSGRERKGLGHYGNPHPGPYANMEEPNPQPHGEDGGYNRIINFQEKVPSNIESKYEYYTVDSEDDKEQLPRSYIVFIALVMMAVLAGFGFALYHMIKSNKDPKYIKIAHIHPKHLV